MAPSIKRLYSKRDSRRFETTWRLEAIFFSFSSLLRPTLDDLLGIARCNGQRRPNIMSNITDGHIQGLFLFERQSGLVRSIWSKRSLTCFGQGDSPLFFETWEVSQNCPTTALKLLFESAPAENPLKQKASEHSPNPRKGQGTTRIRTNPYIFFSFQRQRTPKPQTVSI